MNRLTRDKETYWMQRYSLGKVETDHIQRFVKKTEKKFEANWQEYEKKLENYLLSKQAGDFKDWIQRKDEAGNLFWTNTTTLKSQKEHPGQKIFQVNKRMLKNKAREELDKNMEDVEERKMMILEAMLGLKGRVSKEVSQMRIDSAMQSRRERAAWRKKATK